MIRVESVQPQGFLVFFSGKQVLLLKNWSEVCSFVGSLSARRADVPDCETRS